MRRVKSEIEKKLDRLKFDLFPCVSVLLRCYMTQKTYKEYDKACYALSKLYDAIAEEYKGEGEEND